MLDWNHTCQRPAAALSIQGNRGGRPHRILVALILLTAVLFASASPAFARERIADYASDIVVAPDGRLTVTETLQVRSTGYRIKHGIYRDLPVAGKTHEGGVDPGAFRLLSASLDGAPARTRVRRRRDYIRIYVGDGGTTLNPEPHSFTLRYKTGPQIRQSDGREEFYWNVTGTEWAFPIDRVRATIHLPGGAAPTRITGFTGPLGSTRQDNLSRRAGPDGLAQVSTQKILNPHEGLTVAVSFPQGFITAPGAWQRLIWTVYAHLGMVVSLLGLIGIGGLSRFLLHKARRQTRPASPLPRFAERSTAPRDTTPAQAQYIAQRRMVGHSALIATALDLEMRKLMTVELTGKVWRLSLTSAASRAGTLAPEEAALIESLRAEGGSVLVERKNRKALRLLFGRFTDALHETYGDRYFKRFASWQTLVAVLCSLLAFALAWIGMDGENRILVYMPLFPMGIGIVASVVERMAGGPKDNNVIGLALGGTLVVSCLLWMLIGLDGGAFGGGPVIGLVGAPVLFWVFASKVGEPTPEGLARAAEIDGLRRYLNRFARGGRANRRQREHLQSLLPYAVALNMKSEWSGAFDRAMGGRNGTLAAHSLPMALQQSFFASNAGGAAIFDACGSLSSKFSACTSASGSSVGGGIGGGGFSGGGGGGGGGGGW